MCSAKVYLAVALCLGLTFLVVNCELTRPDPVEVYRLEITRPFFGTLVIDSAYFVSTDEYSVKYCLSEKGNHQAIINLVPGSHVEIIKKEKQK